ncbi:hypothetical protein Fcan01_25060 [Folsomia candida]|uniref:Uncharacterized protein n=1 Tax=Folsomia candida TaxID=158441 RepID=A0A226D7Q4_FOLCA|nr:hypothetical protein Fcan01_25060 [Folsomia candida]
MFDHLVEKGFRLYSIPISEDRYKFIIPQTLMTFRWGLSELDINMSMRYIIWVGTLSKKLRGALSTLRNHRLCAARKTLVKSWDVGSLSCEGLNWTLFYKDNYNLLKQTEQEFETSELGRMAGISEVLNASLISDIAGKCDKTAVVAPSVYLNSKSYMLKILGGTSSQLNRKPYVKSIDTAFSRRVYIRIQKWGDISEAFKDKIVRLVEGGFYRFWEDFIIQIQTTGGIWRRGRKHFPSSN